MMREVDAFSYWPDHASAIYGFGGRRRSPDPRYCFHTMYNDARPGPARYVLRMSGVKASHGELSLRVHAFRPPDDVQISLVAGARLALDQIDRDEVNVEVRFSVLRGVLYAFYGYFSEDSDIEAEHFNVELHEYDGDEVEDFVEPPRSALALDKGPSDARPANALIHLGDIDVQTPVSQDCTISQLAAVEAKLGRREPGLAKAMVRWREQICLASLEAYGVTLSGLDGILAGPATEQFRDDLASRPFIMRQVADAAGFAEGVTPDDFADFLLWPDGPAVDDDAQERWWHVEAALERLKMGGIAAIGLTYRFHARLPSSSAATDHVELSRNEIGQWVLRLIGKGFSVAPLAFAAQENLAFDDDAVASFVLIVQRQ